MKKKISIIALAITIVIQLAVPCLGIYQKHDLLENGEIYSFRVSWICAYEYSNYCKVDFSIQSENTDAYGKYMVLSQDSDGFAYIAEATNKKPSGSNYIINPNGTQYFELPTNSFKTDLELYNKLYQLSCEDFTLLTVTASVVVKDGICEALGLYVNGTAIEDFVSSHYSDNLQY